MCDRASEIWAAAAGTNPCLAVAFRGDAPWSYRHMRVYIWPWYSVHDQAARENDHKPMDLRFSSCRHCHASFATFYNSHAHVRVYLSKGDQNLRTQWWWRKPNSLAKAVGLIKNSTDVNHLLFTCFLGWASMAFMRRWRSIMWLLTVSTTDSLNRWVALTIRSTSRILHSGARSGLSNVCMCKLTHLLSNREGRAFGQRRAWRIPCAPFGSSGFW